ncbi:hypothetical protein [Methanobrevibacter sp.]|uniref:hypothetical protein n=1 Tax=Methanobrevibacter sp. TaxID=66852 RepID=UPI0025D7C5F9|nr:hypothetical protein [Methanobrevibacter sp.]MBQ6512371.1 hypothetical protein [Methanobrevibacter sp.]
MTCHYHPERESTDKCAICGKQICKECGLEIAGKVYCKDCLQKIVGVGLDETTENQPVEDPISETEYLQPEDIYSPQEEVVSTKQEPIVQEYQKIDEDSPYNIKDNIGAGTLESSYLHEEKPQAAPIEDQAEQSETIVEEEYDIIYPDHSYQPEPTSARLDLEDKYEKYLDDLYFDEAPLEEQLAKDEEKFGSLTKKPKKAKPKEAPAKEQKMAKSQRPETPEEMEARIRAEILQESGLASKVEDDTEKSIHNLNYQEEKEPMGIVDIILTVILIIVILIVIYYLIYLFLLHNSYPTFMDAVFGLKNPQNVINNLLSSGPK